ncbi:MAG: hypothetical protein ACK55I_36785, partial [bacterium]
YNFMEELSLKLVAPNVTVQKCLFIKIGYLYKIGIYRKWLFIEIGYLSTLSTLSKLVILFLPYLTATLGATNLRENPLRTIYIYI